MNTKYLFIYNTIDNSLKDSAFISIEDWYDDLPIFDWLECAENKNKQIISYYSNIPFNLVLEHIGENLILSKTKWEWGKFDPEKIMLKNIGIKYNDIYNKEYYDNLIEKICNSQNAYNNAFNIREI